MTTNIAWNDTEDRSRIGRRSKGKGDGYERRISKILSKWWGQDESFRRVPRSGAWDRKRAPGDVLCMEHLEKFPFIVETRKNESWRLRDLTDLNIKAGILSWWIDKKKDHGPESLMWFIFSKNHEDDYVMMTEREASKLRIINNHQASSADHLVLDNPRVLVPHGFSMMLIYRLSTFLEDVPSQRIKDFIRSNP